VSPSVEFNDLVTQADIGRRLGLTRQRIGQLIEEDPRFPEPVGELGNYRIWEWPHVQRWAANAGYDVSVRPHP
jgi:hypothetical protein